jgi:chaperonin cofactor prefoldin
MYGAGIINEKNQMIKETMENKHKYEMEIMQLKKDNEILQLKLTAMEKENIKMKSKIKKLKDKLKNL